MSRTQSRETFNKLNRHLRHKSDLDHNSHTSSILSVTDYTSESLITESPVSYLLVSATRNQQHGFYG